MSSITLAVSTQRPEDALDAKIPTPLESPHSDLAMSKNTLISISTTFYPGAQTSPLSSDLMLLSSDSVFFYVHTNVLLSASQNNFDSLLPAVSLIRDNEAIVPVSEPSDVLNIVLHTIYDISCTHYSPALPTLLSAVDALTKYRLDVRAAIKPASPLFSLLLSHAPASPLDVYALAARHDLHDLAVSASPHLLSFPLDSLSDDAAHIIGPLYLKRLFFLHIGRTDALKRLLLFLPRPHAPTANCDFAEQKKLARAWVLASAYLVWEIRADMPGSTLEAAFTPLIERLRCARCHEIFRERIRSLIVQWSIVKRKI